MDYYCSQKFWWFSIDVERRITNSCCSASGVSIDQDWLRKNPGQLFNSPWLVKERQQMLLNQPAATCEDACWRAERENLPSRRIQDKSDNKTHHNIISSPETIHLNLGSDCNLTCSYCCKQYSTAWLRDIDSNGSYLDENRYKISDSDRKILKFGQTKIKNSIGYQEILNEVKQYKNVRRLVIAGGEPLLYNGLVPLVNGFEAEIVIYTGLGVSFSRLKKLVDELPSHITFTVSAENIGALYEFNRYGSKWEDFLRNYEYLNSKFATRFNSVLSNITVHGLKDFQSQFGSSKNLLNLCMDPTYLGANVLDETSLQQIRSIEYEFHNDEIKQYVQAPAKEVDNQKFKTYIIEFARRRDLDLRVFPENFYAWIVG